MRSKTWNVRDLPTTEGQELLGERAARRPAVNFGQRSMGVRRAVPKGHGAPLMTVSRLLKS